MSVVQTSVAVAFVIGCVAGRVGAQPNRVRTHAASPEPAVARPNPNRPFNPNGPAPLIPLEDFFRNPAQESFSLSKDGRHYAYLAPHEGRMNVFVQDLRSPLAPPKRVTNERDRDVAGFFWKADFVVFIRDKDGDENFHLHAVKADGTNSRELTPGSNVRAGVIDELAEHPTDMLIQTNKRNPELFDVYRINIATGQMTEVFKNPGGFSGYLADHAGSIRVATGTDGVNNTFFYRPTEADTFRKVFSTNFREQVAPIVFSPDNTKLYAVSNRNGRDKLALVVLDPATGREEKTLYENPEYDVQDAVYSKKLKKLVAAVYTSHKMELHFLDESRKQLDAALRRKLGAEALVVPVSATLNEDKYIVAVTSDRIRRVYYLYDVASDSLRLLANAAPWLKPEQLAPVKPIRLQSRDGLTLNGYLTLPLGAEPANLPTVVVVHGGPWARDEWGFDPEAQFLANRGYAVLQLNFRGSTGYGRGFWEASFGQWGLNMQNDISDGVEFLIGQGISDKSRVAIYGGSYGGYATLAGLAFTPELYACGIDYVGVANLFTFLNTIPPYWEPYREMMYAMVGHPQRDSARLRETSPVFHAERIRAPLLIVQGAQDPRVNKNESEQMVEAMRARGVQVRYILKDNEGHGFRNEENRIELYKEMETFLDQHCKHQGREIGPNSRPDNR